ncbi:MAG: hypothetical protein HY272_01915 [Gammaproteobacteria bacterium]|nr:hypothetical protein [Gammaproteobacteria bacterium]
MSKANVLHSDFRGFDDFIEVFRAGEQVSSDGTRRTWSNDELDQMVANHSAATAAPIVIGHPQVNDPAYGWVNELKRDGDSLFAKFRDVHPEFSKAAEDGAYRKRSVRVYKTPQNGFALEHVGFLGAKRPAIALDAMNYSARAEGEVFDFEADWVTPNILARMMRRMREFLIEKFGAEEADRVMPDYEVSSLADHANSIMNDNAKPSSIFSAPNKGETIVTPEEHQAALDAAVKKAQADFSAQQTTLQQQLDAERRQRLQGEFSAFVKGSHLTPAQAEGAVDFMLQLSDATEAQFEFSAGEGDKAQKIKKSPLQWFKDFVSAVPQQVALGESAAENVKGERAEFTAPQGHAVDGEQLAKHQKAKDYQAAHPGTDYMTAVSAVSKL